MSPVKLTEPDTQSPFLDRFAKLEQILNDLLIRTVVIVKGVHDLPRIPSLEQSTHFLHITLNCRRKRLFGDVIRHKQNHIEQIATTKNIVDYPVRL